MARHMHLKKNHNNCKFGITSGRLVGLTSLHSNELKCVTLSFHSCGSNSVECFVTSRVCQRAHEK
eukprot:3278707-Amphidinium_carterae.1